MLTGIWKEDSNGEARGWVLFYNTLTCEWRCAACVRWIQEEENANDDGSHNPPGQTPLLRTVTMTHIERPRRTTEAPIVPSLETPSFSITSFHMVHQRRTLRYAFSRRSTASSHCTLPDDNASRAHNGKRARQLDRPVFLSVSRQRQRRRERLARNRLDRTKIQTLCLPRYPRIQMQGN